MGTSSTLDKPAPRETTEGSADRQPTTQDWPSAYVTWRRYCFIGRWNYAKGLTLATLLGGLGVPLWGAQSLAWALGSAVAYILVSCGGLYLLYGPPSRQMFIRLLRMAAVCNPHRVLDIHYGTYRSSRELLELLPATLVDALGIQDSDHEPELAVQDVWKFERPPLSHARFAQVNGRYDLIHAPDNTYDLVVLGFGIHELHEDEERLGLMREIHRVLTPKGKLLLFERGWSPVLALVFGPLFLHFTPAKTWHAWLRSHFHGVQRGQMWGMVDLFVAEDPRVD